MAGQLNLFRDQPAPEPAGCPDMMVEPGAAPEPVPRRTQMTELAGETWEDAVG